MSTVSRDELRTLLNTHADHDVSPYIPTARRGVASTQQNPIRFKNALRQAEDRLRACGMRPLEAQAMLEPAAHLLQHTTAGARSGYPLTGTSWMRTLGRLISFMLTKR